MRRLLLLAILPGGGEAEDPYLVEMRKIDTIPVDLLEKEQRIDEEMSRCVKLVTP